MVTFPALPNPPEDAVALRGVVGAVIVFPPLSAQAPSTANPTTAPAASATRTALTSRCAWWYEGNSIADPPNATVPGTTSRCCSSSGVRPLLNETPRLCVPGLANGTA